MDYKELEKKIIEKAWQDKAYKADLLADPKKVLEKELGQPLPAGINIKVVEETTDTLYFRLPVDPGSLTDSELDNVSGGLGCGRWDCSDDVCTCNGACCQL